MSLKSQVVFGLMISFLGLVHSNICYLNASQIYQQAFMLTSVAHGFLFGYFLAKLRTV